MIFKGFKFGMMLQLAIGPVCLFVFKVGGNRGFINAETTVFGVALVDALYIALAILGIATFIKKEEVKYILKIVGALVVASFGIKTILGIFGWQIIPFLNFFARVKSENPFLQGLVLTASNPLTILFWAGVLSAKIAEEKLKRRDVYLFGVGALMATLFFLTLIALVGSFSRYFLPVKVITILNFVVGVALIYFAFRMIFKKDKIFTEA